MRRPAPWRSPPAAARRERVIRRAFRREWSRPIRASAASLIVAHRGDVEKAMATRFAAERDVLRDRKVRQQAQLLIDGGDAELDRAPRAADLDWRSGEQNFAGVGLEHPGDDVDHRRLAGAVLPDHRMDLAALHGERHLIERQHAGKVLGQSPDFQRRRGGRRRVVGHRVRQAAGQWPAARYARPTDRSLTISASGFSNGKSWILFTWSSASFIEGSTLSLVISTPWIRRSVVSFFFVATR